MGWWSSIRRIIYNFFLCVSFSFHNCYGEWEGKARKPVYHTSWMSVVTPTDRYKSVLNRCVFESFGGISLYFVYFSWFFVYIEVLSGLSQIFSFFLNMFHSQENDYVCLSWMLIVNYTTTSWKYVKYFVIPWFLDLSIVFVLFVSWLIDSNIHTSINTNVLTSGWIWILHYCYVRAHGQIIKESVLSLEKNQDLN